VYTSPSNHFAPPTVSTSFQLVVPYQASVNSNLGHFQLTPQTLFLDPRVSTNLSSPSQPFIAGTNMSPPAFMGYGHPPMATPSDWSSPNPFIQQFVDSIQDISVSGIRGQYINTATPTTFSGPPSFLPLQQSTSRTGEISFSQTPLNQPASVTIPASDVSAPPDLTWSDDPFVYPGNDSSVFNSIELLPPQGQSLAPFTSGDPLGHNPPAPSAFSPPLNLSTLSKFPTPPDRPPLSFNSLEFWQRPQDVYQNLITLPTGDNSPSGIPGQSPNNAQVSSTPITPFYGANIIPQSQTGSCDGSMDPRCLGVR